VEYPRRVTALGGKYAVQDNREIPDTLVVLWEYDGTLVTFSQYNANAALPNPLNAEIELRGTKGTMYLKGGHWEVVPEQVPDLTFFARTPLDRQSEKAYKTARKAVIQAKSAGTGADGTPAHARNFLDCIKSRAKCNADVLIGHVSTATTLLGNIAHKTASLLEWDGKTERFTNNEAANRLLQYKYRSPYKLS
jgi:hypothetical protein